MNCHTVSPPPLKRQKHSHVTAAKPHIPSTSSSSTSEPISKSSLQTPGSIRIFTWNINGIAPYVEAYFQQSIDSFFAAAVSSRRKRVIRSPYDDDDDDGGGDGQFAFDDGEAEDPDKERRPSLRAFLRRQHWPHVLLLQEVKIRPGDTRTMDAVKKAINDPLPRTNSAAATPASTLPSSTGLLSDNGPAYTVHFNLPGDPYNAKGFGGRVYGIATIIREDFAGRYVSKVRDVDWDLEGRVSVIETKDLSPMLDKNHPNDPSTESSSFHDPKTTTAVTTMRCTRPSIPPKLAIVNIYAVNGTTNPYYSPTSGRPEGTRHDRKLAVHRHLLQESHSLEGQGFSVLIAGDLNIAPQRIDGYPNLRTWPVQHCINRADFNRRFLGGGYSRGNDRRTADETGSGGLGSNTSNHQPSSHDGNHNDDSNVTKSNQSQDQTQPFQGIDTFRFHHGPSVQKYSYYPRTRPWATSCDRVDLIITSENLCIDTKNKLEKTDRETRLQLKDADICDNRRDRGRSDHCPVWVELKVRTYEDIQEKARDR